MRIMHFAAIWNRGQHCGDSARDFKSSNENEEALEKTAKAATTSNDCRVAIYYFLIWI